MYKNWLAERGEDFRSGIQIATVDPFQGQQERHRRSTPRHHQRPRCLSYRQARWRRSRRGASPRPARHDRSPRTHRLPPLPRSAIFCAPRATGSPHAKRNASVRPSRQMRRISVSTSPTFTGQVREVFHQAIPAQGRRLVACLIQRLPPVPSLKSLAWAGPYASGRTHLTTTSTPTEQATAPRKPSTDIIELGRRIARGYRNPTSYQLRMLLIAGGLDASTHTQL